MTTSIENENKSALTIIILAVILVACLAPFANKAFHIDDPLFIWAAQQIQIHPFDFYGFTVNWYGTDMPMSEITKNPPLASYYIASAASLFGWNEVSLHLAFLIPALGATLGTYFLAKHFCQSPALATLAGVLTPAFLLSSTTLMCDTMMLCFWVWAVVFWIRGLKSNKYTTLSFAALLITMSALTKYFGVSLIPLLFVYSLAQKRRFGRWALFLLVPIVILAGYQWATYTLYGHGLLLDAVISAEGLKSKEDIGFILKGLIGLSFTGGCLATSFFYAPLLWSRRVWVAGVLLVVVLLGPLSMMKMGSFSLQYADGVRWSLVIQLSLFIIAGLNVLVLTIVDIYRHRDADSLLLFLWVVGTFIFASFINWTLNGRSILPMAPVLGILLVRRINQHRGPLRLKGSQYNFLPLIPAALLALCVTWADYRLANTSRRAVEAIHNKYENFTGTVWFKGYWGFKYYMESAGSKTIDFIYSRPAEDDIVIIPLFKSGVSTVPRERFRLIHTFRFPSSRWLTTMDFVTGAAFYSSKWGPFPFVLSANPREVYHVFLVTPPA